MEHCACLTLGAHFSRYEEAKLLTYFVPIAAGYIFYLGL
jgi:hypothetical protein